MKLNVYNLTLKIRKYRPRVVCFVGKKIWDIYESVISKSASPPVDVYASDGRDDPEHVVKKENEGFDIKEEQDELREISAGTVSFVNLDQNGNIKLKPLDNQNVPPMNTTDVKLEPGIHPTNDDTRKGGKKLVPIDWYRPRLFRLEHEKGYTYFWVTPNTSGLERTPVCVSTFGS